MSAKFPRGGGAGPFLARSLSLRPVGNGPHKIHCGAESIDKDKYLTPAQSLKSTRSSHSVQYCRYQTYSDALKNYFPLDYSTVE